LIGLLWFVLGAMSMLAGSTVFRLYVDAKVHFAMSRRMRLSAIRCSRKRMFHEWAMASEARDIRVKHSD
jgi:hypothetical protein